TARALSAETRRVVNAVLYPRFGLPSREDLQALVDRLGHPGSWTAATEVLLDAGPERFAALRAGLSHDDPEVRRLTARALAHVPLDRETFEELLTLIRTEPLPWVRKAVVRTLACGAPERDPHSPGVDVVGVLIDVLRNDPSAE